MGFKSAIFVMVAYVGLGIAGLVGWVMNVVDIANSDFGNVTGMLVLRIIGVIVAPLGAVLGYF